MVIFRQENFSTSVFAGGSLPHLRGVLGWNVLSLPQPRRSLGCPLLARLSCFQTNLGRFVFFSAEMNPKSRKEMLEEGEKKTQKKI